jgi:sarcosine oxidase subunit gamma
VTAERVLLDDSRLQIVETAQRNLLNLRIAPDLGSRWTDVLGAALPTKPNTLIMTDTGWLAWLGPDEWLAVSSGESDPDSVSAELWSAAGDAPASVVDVSAARVTLRISGAGARQLLAHGCALDLHPRVFPVGRCAQTRLGYANVLIAMPTDAQTYEVLVRASFTRYLIAWLLDAATAVISEPAIL